MAGRHVNVVLVPRFTSYVGTWNFLAAPIPVSAYEAVQVTFWHGPLLGTLPVISIGCAESNDGETWQDATGGTWAVGQAVVEQTFRANLTMAWMRFNVALQGTSPSVTCWAEGFFDVRET